MTDSYLKNKLPHFIALTRLNRPIGIYLLMWPMLWGLWFAAGGVPRLDVLLIFILGAVLTRSAGCAINDYADRHIDGHVARTRHRPLATGALRPREALWATAVLMGVAFLLVLLTNRLTIALSFVALALAVSYPFAKRFTQWPQLVLGAAFAFAIPMAFAAQTGAVGTLGWSLYITAALWALAYDTLYAMADRADDVKIGVKSTAILFGRADLLVVGAIQLLVLSLLAVLGWQENRGFVFMASLIASLGFVGWQLYRSRHRDPQRCFDAFLNNHWIGLVVFIGLVVDFAINP